MILNKNYKGILQLLVDENVMILFVGAYALAALAYPRATMVIDL